MKKALAGIDPFDHKIWLSSPTMHGHELEYMTEAFQTNWMSTVGKNINEVEQIVAERVGCGYAVALSAGTAAEISLQALGPGLYFVRVSGTDARLTCTPVLVR